MKFDYCMALKHVFCNLIQTYCNKEVTINSYWLEIERKYSSKKRYYHTLDHLATLIDQLHGSKELVEDWDTILFAVFYHDIIYNVLRSDNEVRSAEFATRRLSSIDYPGDKMDLCKKQILATKDHQPSKNGDIKLFTDTDLSILGQPYDVYTQYCMQIRKEYSIYPDFIYNNGRKKVLNHFLHMERIFKTPTFYNKYETRARSNLQAELVSLL